MTVKIINLEKYSIYINTALDSLSKIRVIVIIYINWLFYYLYNTKNKLSTILHFHIIDLSD